MPRSTDLNLAGALTAKGRRLTAIVGPPKAGKTRSLLEVLRTAVPDATVWWVNAAPRVLPNLVATLEREIGGSAGNTASTTDDDSPLVVVLDDAHLCGTNPADGLTAHVLDRLTKAALTVVTIHAHQLATWTRAVTDHAAPGADLGQLAGIGATRGLIKRIQSARVDWIPDLDPDEYAAAINTLANSHHVTHEPGGTAAIPATASRLAEYLAAVGVLCDRADEGLTAGGYRAAAIIAALDATILYPDGATLSQLAELTRWVHADTAPTRLWDEPEHHAALDWLTAPIGGPGSPHAILTASPSRTGYRLLDALAGRLTSPSPHLQHIRGHAAELPPDPAFLAGVYDYGNDDPCGAATWWVKAAEAGHTDAMCGIAVLNLEQGDAAAAITWLTKAADAGHTHAMFGLGSLYQQQGDIPTAITWYTKAADAGHTDAMFNLGVLHDQQATSPSQ